MDLHRYDIILAELKLRDQSGSIQKKKRPYIIVSNEKGTINANIITVMPLTHIIKKKHLPVHGCLQAESETGLSAYSMILGEQPQTICKEEVIKRLGNVTESDSKKVNIITTTKTQKSNRIIPMNETSYVVLEELQKRQKEMGINSDYIISTKDGSVMLVRVLEQTFSRICEENGICYRGVHTLRHTFGSILVRKGVDIKVISEILGHSTV